jgi:hypothetical protein
MVAVDPEQLLVRDSDAPLREIVNFVSRWQTLPDEWIHFVEKKAEIEKHGGLFHG